MEAQRKSFFLRHRTVFILNFSAIAIFCVMAWHVMAPVSPFDASFQIMAQNVRSSSLTPVMVSVTNTFQPTVIYILSLIISAVLYFKKRVQWALFFLFSTSCTLISVAVFKDVFEIARPLNPLTSVIGWSFPSGHAATSAVFFFIMLYAVEKRIHQSAIVALWFLVAVLLVIGVSISRVYLGVHYMSDVVAGIALGTFWATLAILLLEKNLEKRMSQQTV